MAVMVATQLIQGANMEVIRLEDLKAWRAARIARGNCNFDDMVALGSFIERVEKIEVEDE